MQCAPASRPGGPALVLSLSILVCGGQSTARKSILRLHHHAVQDHAVQEHTTLDVSTKGRLLNLAKFRDKDQLQLAKEEVEVSSEGNLLQVWDDTNHELCDDADVDQESYLCVNEDEQESSTLCAEDSIGEDTHKQADVPRTCGEPVGCNITLLEDHLVTSSIAHAGHGPAELRFSNACPGQQPVDFLVQPMSPYDAPPGNQTSSAFARSAKIGVKADTSVTLKVSFVQHGTYNPVKVQSFYISVLDIDAHKSIKTSSFHSYTISRYSALQVTHWESDAIFTSDSEVSNEVSDPMKLTFFQARHAVAFHFVNATSIELTLRIDNTSTFAHGNMLITGASDILCVPTRSDCSRRRRSHCSRRRRRRSCEPTMEPTTTTEPTPEPTSLPTLTPTEEPTANPTGAPTFEPTSTPTEMPTAGPTVQPTETENPTSTPTLEPTAGPTAAPILEPTPEPTSLPTAIPTKEPTVNPTVAPTFEPSLTPTEEPTAAPTAQPTDDPTATPTLEPTAEPTAAPTLEPTPEPTTLPTAVPTKEPTAKPTGAPTFEPTLTPTEEPTAEPTAQPTENPTATPTLEPTAEPTAAPTLEPTPEPTTLPTAVPTKEPTAKPTGAPTFEPTLTPTEEPTAAPTAGPTENPTATPTLEPTAEPTAAPTLEPTPEPTALPTASPTEEPTANPTGAPTFEPTLTPTEEPTAEPTAQPTQNPTATPTLEPTAKPTAAPTLEPTPKPTTLPTATPTKEPTANPTGAPTLEPTLPPTEEPTAKPTAPPTENPTATPTLEPTAKPTATPTLEPTPKPTTLPTATPTKEPTANPTGAPTLEPTLPPTEEPTAKPTAPPTENPTATPTLEPTAKPTAAPTLEPTPSPTKPCSPPPTCNLSFTKDNLAVSNLGGTMNNADKPYLMFRSVCPGITGVPNTSLVIKNTSEYTPAKAEKTGYWSEWAYANINIRHGTSVDLVVEFQDDDENPITLKSVYFTILDLDHGGYEGSQEVFSIDGFTNYTLSSDTLIDVKQHGPFTAEFGSTIEAGAENNPNDPMNLTKQQEQLAVSFLFTNVSWFKMRLEVRGMNHTSGRNFLFKGLSSVSHVCPTQTSASLASPMLLHEGLAHRRSSGHSARPVSSRIDDDDGDVTAESQEDHPVSEETLQSKLIRNSAYKIAGHAQTREIDVYGSAKHVGHNQPRQMRKK